jgi:hypothetical protein
MSKKVLLSFDVEEFDMPLEYHHAIEVEDQMRIGIEGLDAITPILESVPCTLFTTANFANHYPERIHTLSLSHEIASHTFYHTAFETEDLLKSRLRLEEITGKKVSGLRMPRMRPVLMEDVKAAGYAYDSSINPTWLPGRYNNFHLPRTVYTEGGIKRIPASVSPGIRIPLFWLSFKNMPYALYLQLCKQTLAKDGYLCLYFHPWEFTPIEQFGLPAYTRRWCGPALVNRLTKLIKDLSTDADFSTMKQLV